MKSRNRGRNFWVGNAVLALAMILLLFMGPLSDAWGIWAVGVWMALAAVGMGLLMSDNSDEPPESD
jgi:hypothetical protein